MNRNAVQYQLRPENVNTFLNFQNESTIVEQKMCFRDEVLPSEIDRIKK